MKVILTLKKVKLNKLIYDHSIFKIKKFYQKYNCEVIFENQNQSINKSFEEILELRIIKYINLISSKGFPNELKYIFEINKVYAIEK